MRSRVKADLSKQQEQIVVTGVGLVTALGITAEETWRGVLAGKPALGQMPALEIPPPPEKGGYQAMDLPIDFAPKLEREARYLRWAIAEALKQAGIDQSLPYPAHRCGVALGTTLHGMRSGGQFLRDGNHAHLQNFMAGSTLQSAIAPFNLAGDAFTTCSACSSSLGSIALAITLLETHELDLVVTGGYDTVSEYAYGGFNSLRLVADGPLRPFSKNRQGMKLGEGYGILVLERAADAQQRGAKAMVNIAGCGESADAHHLTQPHPQGQGAAAAINGALLRAELPASQIDLVAAHATGTPDNDAGEHAALANVFANRATPVPVVAFKSHLGHTLGGAGAVELILSAMALRDQTIPACANITAEDLEFTDIDVVTGVPRHAPIRATLNTSLGFGGANTCAVLTTPVEARNIESGNREKQRVFITGVGMIVPQAVGIEAFIERLSRENNPAWTTEYGPVAEGEFVHLLNARRVRRMSDYVKLSLAATALACTHAGIADLSSLDPTCPVLLGTAHGSATYCIEYYRQIVASGYPAANPMLFAEGVPNAAAAHLSLMLGLKGACQTVIGSRTAGLDALRLAWLRIASGQWDRAIVGAAEENVPLVNEAYRHAGLYAGSNDGPPFISRDGFNAGWGAVTLILESRAAMERRSARALGRLENCSTLRLDPHNPIKTIGVLLKNLDHPSTVLSSANGTWIDRVESAALHRTGLKRTMWTLYGSVPELFSAGPLAAIARGICAPLPGPTPIASFGVLCTGYTGTVAGVRVTPHYSPPAPPPP
jgi:3-oxoacyl-[acyl-carrier-protein] synthase II